VDLLTAKSLILIFVLNIEQAHDRLFTCGEFLEQGFG
jgi:hypothetical protein